MDEGENRGEGEAPRESDERGPATNPSVYVLAQRDVREADRAVRQGYAGTHASG